jgi:hypothetical protein
VIAVGLSAEEIDTGKTPPLKLVFAKDEADIPE